jgi:hypothetical protein
MELDPLRYALWILDLLLQVGLFSLILYRRAGRDVPFFASYVGVNLAQGIAWWTVVHTLGFNSRAAFSFYWISQAVVFAARGLAILELCHHFLRPYRGIWGLAWRVLALVCALLVIYAAVTSARQTYWLGAFVPTADQGLELAALGTLMVLLGFAAYYKIPTPTVERQVALGFAFYSLVTVGLDALVLLSYRNDFLYSLIQSVAFAGVLIVWLVALRKPLPGVASAPELLGREEYGALTPQVNYRLQLLNNRLLEILRS